MNASFRLVSEVRRTLLSLPKSERGLVVAVSGGPDSVALLRALLAARSPQTPLVIAHLNHQLRGPDSDADAAFVAELHTALAGHFPPLQVENERRDVLGRLASHRLRYVGIDVSGDGDVRVTEPLRDDLGMRAVAEHDRRRGMAEVMKSDPRQPCALDNTPQRPAYRCRR